MLAIATMVTKATDTSVMVNKLKHDLFWLLTINRPTNN